MPNAYDTQTRWAQAILGVRGRLRASLLGARRNHDSAWCASASRDRPHQSKYRQPPPIGSVRPNLSSAGSDLNKYRV
eukprot:6204716-Pleurochrysis_carterae.AAC.1